MEFWYDIKTSKPEFNKRLLICDGSNQIFVGLLREIRIDANSTNCYWEDMNGKSLFDITHWMPLPDNPSRKKS